ncbi:MAG: biotin--[acetyl-CoA-carboxylase] ligase [Spirochaetales bacterium]
MESDPLWDSSEIVRDHLIPRRYHVACCDSTMSQADAMLERENIELPFVLTTDHQRRGQGTHGRRWEDAPATSLMATILLPPSLADALLPLRMGTAVCDLLCGLGARDVALKWPNDCLCGNRKVAGILCRHGARRVAVGIGINVTSTPEVNGSTSVYEALGGGTQVSPFRLREPLLNRCAELLTAPAQRVPRMCRRYLWRRGSTVRVAEVTGEAFEATVVDIAADGALVVDRCSAGPGMRVRHLVRAGRISLP